eukprot:Rmarinus@m.24534
MRNSLGAIFSLLLMREFCVRANIAAYLPHGVLASPSQQTALVVLGLTVVMAGISRMYSNLYLEAFSELGVAGAVLLWCFLADRTSLFDHGPKSHSAPLFLAMVTAFVVCGAMKRVRMKEGGALTTERTMEWKGAMQAILLIYHYTGTSQNLLIYQCIRLIVTAYIFLTGYGHTYYFLKTSDYSWARVGNVLFRYNFSTVFLCWVMGLPYQKYYFVPLCTFWFLVVWGTLVLGGPTVNKLPHIIPIKVLALVSFLFCVYLPGLTSDPSVPSELFTRIFGIWPVSQLFYVNGSLQEWWFRSRLDMFAAPAGMVAAYVVYNSKESSFMASLPTLPRYRFGVLAFVVASVVGFWAHALSCPSKPVCNEGHLWISPFMVLAYVGALAVSPEAIRNFTSPLFSYFGRISLELFLLQYHIFLADDTMSLLAVIPEYPVANFLVVAASFVFCSHVLSNASSALAAVVAGKEATEQSLGEKLLELKQLVLLMLMVCAIPTLAGNV